MKRPTMREADKVGTLVPGRPGYDRVQLGMRRQAGTSAEMPQEPGHSHLLPGCARLMLLHERAYMISRRSRFPPIMSMSPILSSRDAGALHHSHGGQSTAQPTQPAAHHHGPVGCRLWDSTPLYSSGSPAWLCAAARPVLPLPCRHDSHVLVAGRGGQALADAAAGQVKRKMRISINTQNLFRAQADSAVSALAIPFVDTGLVAAHTVVADRDSVVPLLDRFLAAAVVVDILVDSLDRHPVAAVCSASEAFVVSSASLPPTRCMSL